MDVSKLFSRLGDALARQADGLDRGDKAVQLIALQDAIGCVRDLAKAAALPVMPAPVSPPADPASIDPAVPAS